MRVCQPGPVAFQRSMINLDREALFESGVGVELGAVVERDRLELWAVAADGAGRRSRHLVHLAHPELLDDRVSGLAFHQREHAVAHVAAHHRVAFPVSDALAQFDLHWPVADGPLAGQHARES